MPRPNSGTHVLVLSNNMYYITADTFMFSLSSLCHGFAHIASIVMLLNRQIAIAVLYTTDKTLLEPKNYIVCHLFCTTPVKAPKM